jgi:type IX secretion system PorP/SprF family membrane protein
MYMWNQLAANPAYAGSRECLSTTLLYRTQWIGIEGAPKTLSLGVHSPLKKEQIALGLNIVNDKIGVSNFTSVAGSYAYRIKLNQKAKLSLGLQACVTSFSNDLNSVPINDDGDVKFISPVKNLLLPNLGAGAYYSTDKAYVGIGIPHLINNNLFEKSSGAITEQQARQYRHLFLMGGYLFNINEYMKLKPSGILKFAPNSPVEIDANISALFYDALWLGVSLRSNFSKYQKTPAESVDLMAIYEINNTMRAGVAYDITSTQINKYNNGTWEFMLGYDFSRTKGNLLSPRYF